MKRRGFIKTIGGIAWPLSALSQQSAKLRVVAIALGSSRSDPESRERSEAFRQGMQSLGWREGQDVRYEYRWMGNNPELARAYAAEIVAIRPDVILASGTVALTALFRETKKVPIVFVNVTDPVAGGFVQSLSNPGGNVTGFTPFEYEIAGKWLEQLKAISPKTSRVALLGDPQNHNFAGFSRAFEVSAARLSVQPVSAPVQTAEQIEFAMTSMAATPNGGVIVTAAIFSLLHRPLIVSLARSKRLPAIYWTRFFPANGGLMSYGPNTDELHKRSADYVDRILKGALPAQLPVQEATKYESVLNLSAARDLGLALPQQLMLSIDELIS